MIALIIIAILHVSSSIIMLILAIRSKKQTDKLCDNIKVKMDRALKMTGLDLRAILDNKN